MRDIGAIMDIVDDHLQQFNKDQEKRSEQIKHLIDFLQYNLRLTELSESEKIDFVNCMEGYPLSEKDRELLKNSDKKKKEYYIDMWARSTYFRRCAWLTYLHTGSDKPPVRS